MKPLIRKLVLVLIVLSVALPAAPSQGTLAANAGPDKTVNVGDSVSFDGTGSTGNIASYNWDFGDGTTASTSSPTKTFSSAGTYTVTLLVVATSGATSTDTASVVVRTSDTAAPNITTTLPTSPVPGSAIDVTATVTDNVAVASATLYYKTGSDTTFNSSTMSCTGSATNKTCSGQIPASVTSATTVNYYVRATDTRSPTANVGLYPSNAPTGTLNLTLQDTAPPSVTVTSPSSTTSATAGQNLTVTATITDNAGVSSATLFWVFGVNGAYDSFTSGSNASMTRTSGTSLSGTWTGTIDMTSVTGKTDVGFYVRATDGTNNATSPANAPVAFSTIGIVSANAPQITHTPPTTATAGTALTVTATVTSNLTLDTVIVRYRTVGTTNFQNVTMTGTGTYSATIPAENVTDAGIEYFIRANDTANNVRNHPSSGLTAPLYVAAPPTTPSGVAAANVAGTVNVTWTPLASTSASSVAGYLVFRSTDGGAFTLLGNVTSGTRGYLVDALPPIGSTAQYKVAAYDTYHAAGVQSAAATLAVTPQTPANLTATADGPGSVLASWDTVRSGARYVLERSTDGSTWTELANVTTASTSASGLTAGAAVQLRVRSLASTLVSSDASSAVSFLPLGAAATPTALTAARVTGGVQIQWTNASSAGFPVTAGYTIHRSTFPSSGFTPLATTTALTYTDTTADAATTYYYRVAASNAFGLGSFTSAVQAAPVSTTATTQVGTTQTSTTTTTTTTTTTPPTATTTPTTPTVTTTTPVVTPTPTVTPTVSTTPVPTPKPTVTSTPDPTTPTATPPPAEETTTPPTPSPTKARTGIPGFELGALAAAIVAAAYVLRPRK